MEYSPYKRLYTYSIRCQRDQEYHEDYMPRKLETGKAINKDGIYYLPNYQRPAFYITGDMIHQGLLLEEVHHQPLNPES